MSWRSMAPSNPSRTAASKPRLNTKTDRLTKKDKNRNIAMEYDGYSLKV